MRTSIGWALALRARLTGQRDAEGRPADGLAQGRRYRGRDQARSPRSVDARAARLIDRIGKAGAAFRSLGDPLWDTSSSQGRLLSTLLAAIADFERDLIRERTVESRKRAMAEGVKLQSVIVRFFDISRLFAPTRARAHAGAGPLVVPCCLEGPRRPP